ncbi:MAG: hypothetical protein IJF33_06710 [Clostridia bacterium]|nr:hypothetical protein [Clostridia bacterium]
MKKKIILVVCIALAIVLLFPIPLQLRDGGTVQYQAVLYSIYDVHRLDFDGDGGCQEGIVIEVLGVEVFNNVK